MEPMRDWHSPVWPIGQFECQPVLHLRTEAERPSLKRREAELTLRVATK